MVNALNFTFIIYVCIAVGLSLNASDNNNSNNSIYIYLYLFETIIAIDNKWNTTSDNAGGLLKIVENLLFNSF